MIPATGNREGDAGGKMKFRYARPFYISQILNDCGIFLMRKENNNATRLFGLILRGSLCRQILITSMQVDNKQL